MLRTLAAIILVWAVVTPAAAQTRQGHGWGHGWGWGHHNQEWQSHQNPLEGFWGGVLGGAIGGWITRETPPASDSEALEPWSREWFAFCSHKYRSFNPEDGTFQPYDGARRFCR